METTVVLLITSLTSAVIGCITFITRASLKSNCVYLKCLCCECRREASDNIEELEMTPTKVEFENPTFSPPRNNNIVV